MHSFNNEARKLALQGVTIVVSTGDDGAAGDANWCHQDSSSDSVLWGVCHSWCDLFEVCVLCGYMMFVWNFRKRWNVSSQQFGWFLTTELSLVLIS